MMKSHCCLFFCVFHCRLLSKCGRGRNTPRILPYPAAPKCVWREETPQKVRTDSRLTAKIPAALPPDGSRLWNRRRGFCGFIWRRLAWICKVFGAAKLPGAEVGEEVEQRSQVLRRRSGLLALDVRVIHILFPDRRSPAWKTVENWDISGYLLQNQSIEISGCSGSPHLNRTNYKVIVFLQKQTSATFVSCNSVKWHNPVSSLGVRFANRAFMPQYVCFPTQMFVKLLSGTSPWGVQKSLC